MERRCSRIESQNLRNVWWLENSYPIFFHLSCLWRCHPRSADSERFEGGVPTMWRNAFKPRADRRTASERLRSSGWNWFRKIPSVTWLTHPCNMPRPPAPVPPSKSDPFTTIAIQNNNIPVWYDSKLLHHANNHWITLKRRLLSQLTSWMFSDGGGWWWWGVTWGGGGSISATPVFSPSVNIQQITSLILQLRCTRGCHGFW